jgi:S1-C subfamily serine protease
VVRPFLGVRTRPVSRTVASYFDLKDENGNLLDSGVLIEEVIANSAAEKAGLLAGDVIMQLNDIKLDENNPLINTLTNFQPGDSVKIIYLRDGKQQDVTVTLGTRQ